MDNEIKTTPSEQIASAGYDVDTVLKSLQEEAGSVTSSSNTIDETINRAINEQRIAAQETERAVESQYGRESGYLLENLTQQRSAMLESRRGGATGAYALQLVDREIEKSLRDLEQRKNEVIAQGNAAAANAISNLMVQQLQFRQQAQQQAFNNLLQIGGLTLQARGQSLAERTQTFQERSAIAGIALEYGLDLKPGETIDSIITRASGLATEDRKLQLEKTRLEMAHLRSQTALSNAQMQRVIQDNKVDDATITSMARAADRNPMLLATITNPSQRALVENKLAEIRQQGVVGTVTEKMEQGMSYEDAYNEIINDPYIDDIPAATAALRKAFEVKKEIETRTLSGDLRAATELSNNFENSVGEYVFGDKWKKVQTYRAFTSAPYALRGIFNNLLQ